MIYDVGDTVTRTLHTTTAPVGAPTVTVTKPDGTTAAGSVTGAHPDFTFSMAADQAGAWLVKWTAPGLGIERDGWYVRPDPALSTALIPVVTVSQARDFIRTTTGSNVETALLDRLCKVATKVADLHVRLARQVTETVTAYGRIQLLRRPVQSLVSVTAIDGSTALTLSDLRIAPTTYDVDRDLLSIYGRYQVTYVGGNYPDEAIEQGALEWVLHRWRASQAHSSSTYGDVGILTDVSDLPNAVRQCWSPYLDEAGIA